MHYCLSLKNFSLVRGDIKINWLQPPYSEANCSQLTYENYTQLLNTAAFWLQPAVLNFDVFSKSAEESQVKGAGAGAPSAGQVGVSDQLLTLLEP